MPYSTVQLLISWFPVCAAALTWDPSPEHIWALPGVLNSGAQFRWQRYKKTWRRAARIPHRVLVTLTASPRRDWPFIVHYIILSNFIYFNEEHTGKRAGRLQVNPISICCSAVSVQFHVKTPVPRGRVKFQTPPEVLPDEIWSLRCAPSLCVRWAGHPSKTV